jgi:predicted GNAT superfamily acetyltransferase
MSPPIQIRKLATLPDFHRCVDLQRSVWGESDLETAPYTAFVVAHQTGGQVIGAFEGELMIGFTMAAVGLHGLTPYLHSHMTAVLESHRNRKIGRLLKLFQREEALARGIRLVEWTFDPLEVRNAHFNLNRLGAIVRTYIPNFYGITTSPLHNNLPTDRLLAEWQLDSRRTIAAIENIPATQPEPVATIHIPAEQPEPIPTVDTPAESSSETVGAALGRPLSSATVRIPAEPARSASDVVGVALGRPLSTATDVLTSKSDLQSRIRSEFQQWFAKGYAATSIRLTPEGAHYGLIPWSDF